MKKHWNFIVRAVDLLLILAVLWQYQQVALVRADAVTARQKEIDEVNAWNTSVLQAQQAAEEGEAESGLKDGTYEGTALGFGDDITVLQHDGEDKPYYTQALTMLDKMLTAQTGDVDIVSGATLTCEGLRDAVQDALGKAAA